MLRSNRFHWILLSPLLASTLCRAATPSFADFDKRAKAGEHLNIVFFGASLTWGANATDPQQTSYRADVAHEMEAAYPQAHFKFWDAAIGGTGSQLGVFRFERDVLRRQPDLVFLDFSANDDIYSDDAETLASYESLVRRIIDEAHAPVVQVLFPFGWNANESELPKMKRRAAHLEIGKAYNTVVGDAIALAINSIKSGKTSIKAIWPNDMVHPGDNGYVLFAEAAWSAFQDGVKRSVVCASPEKMIYADTYMKHARVRISSLGTLPNGWQAGAPNLTSAYFDMLMSRWLDDETVAVHRKQSDSKEVDRLKLKFKGSMLMLFGEGTPKSSKYRVYIDGKLVEHTRGNNKEPLKEYDSAEIARPSNGNTHHVQVISSKLDPAVEHTLEIEPVFSPDKDEELRLESICVAGGQASVSRE